MSSTDDFHQSSAPSQVQTGAENGFPIVHRTSPGSAHSSAATSHRHQGPVARAAASPLQERHEVSQGHIDVPAQAESAQASLQGLNASVLDQAQQDGHAQRPLHFNQTLDAGDECPGWAEHRQSGSLHDGGHPAKAPASSGQATPARASSLLQQPHGRSDAEHLPSEGQGHRPALKLRNLLHGQLRWE